MKVKSIRVISLILAFLLISSVCSFAKIDYLPINVGNPLSNLKMFADGMSGYDDLTAEITYAQRIIAEEEISIVGTKVPSWSNNIGDITITVYKWNKTFQDSIKSEPIGIKTYIDFTDNSFLSAVIGENKGDILMVLSTTGTDRVGVWVGASHTDQTVKQVTFKNGIETDGCLCSGIVIKKRAGNDVATAVKDAYKFIEPGTRDEISGFGELVASDDFDKKTEYGMLVSPKDAKPAYAGFYNVDFGSTSPESVLFRIFAMECENYGEVQLCLDSPSGEIISSARYYFDVNVADGEHYWMEIVSDMAVEVTGVHDVYLVCRAGEANKNNTIIGKFKFLKEEAEKTGWEKEVEEYKHIADSELKWTYSDTWTATDMLGRKLPDNSQVGDIKDKDVIMFYWTWTARKLLFSATLSNNQQVVDNYPGDISEIKNKSTYPAWKSPGTWNESIYGYYSLYDKWVVRKQMELFAAAGIDALATDCTNGACTYVGGYMNLLRTMYEMRKDGYQTPKLTFILPWSANANNTYDIENLYTGLYSGGLYEDLWYRRGDKPILMGHSGGNLLLPTGNDAVDKAHKMLNEFFEFHPPQMGYKVGQQVENQWPWCSVAPQPGFGVGKNGNPEIVAVSVAQNSNDDVPSYTAMNGEGVYGRSYTYKDKHTKLSDTSLFYGYNFQEQWDNALAMDPEIVFITGWNEWIAWYYPAAGSSGTDVVGAYVDEWIDEYSRDIEPTKGQLKDTYYLQLVRNIRKFKGVNKTPEAKNPKTIDVTGSFSQWSKVGPEFIGYKGGTESRNSKGIGKYSYTNYTGRNDIVLSKVSHDSEKLYFYVETAENLTPYTDKNWMRLYINSDRLYSTGWEGYDFIVNRTSPSANEVTVEKYTGVDNNWKWEEAGKYPYKLEGNKLMLEIPRSVLKIGKKVDIEFKWNDNCVNDGDIMDFYSNGDTAPVGRFNYRYVEDVAASASQADEPIDVSTNLDILTRKFVVMSIDNPVAYSKGHRTLVDPENETVTPVIINGKTYVPIKFLGECLGAVVTWNEATSTAEIELCGTKISVKEDAHYMRVESERTASQTRALTINDRSYIPLRDLKMYIPLRDIIEGFGLECYWEDPGLIVIGNGVNSFMDQHDDIPERLMERIGMK